MLAKCQLPFSTVHFQYQLLHNITVGNHEYEKKDSVYTPLLVCKDFYRNGTIYPSNETFEIDAHVDTGKHDYYLQERLITVLLKYTDLHVSLQCQVKDWTQRLKQVLVF